MLSAADADLARRDIAVPGLATLLDPDAFVAALRRAVPRIGQAMAAITYVRYKPGTSCLVGYQLEMAGMTVDVSAQGYRADDRERFAQARQRPGVPGPFGPGYVILEDRRIVVSFFPNDGQLKMLSRLADAASRRILLRKILPDRPDLWKAEIDTLRYKPARRYVARLSTENGPRAVLKAYTESGYQAAQANARRFNSSGSFRLARRLGRSVRHRLLVLEWLPGHLLSDILAEPGSDPRVLQAVGAALAELHAQKPFGLPVRTRQEEAASLFPVAAWLGHVCPALAGQARGLANRLAVLLEDQPTANHAVHGDFHAMQVLLGPDGIALLDFDEGAAGDPALDLGLFLAHLERDVLRDNISPKRAEPLRDALLQGYREATAHSFPENVDLYFATGLLRLAPHSFRHRESHWPEHTRAMLERAEAVLRTRSAHALAAPVPERRHVAPKVPVLDPFRVTGDLKMPFLLGALHPPEVQRQLEHSRPRLDGAERKVHLRAIRVVRYKPGRRCLIEYDVEVERPGASPALVTLVGKARAKGVDKDTYALQEELWNTNFHADSADGVSVPEPIGILPRFRMWLQRKVPGVLATELLAGPSGNAVSRRIAAAIHKLHRIERPGTRRHTQADELGILRKRLAELSQNWPEWAERLERVLEACCRLVGTIPEPTARGIHRDFYPDQVLVDGPRLYLLDFDLYCQGDPSLDVGNFLGHLTEQSIRTFGRPDALAERERILEEHFVALAGAACRPAVRAYALLTLVRHVSLSTQSPRRRAFTEPLLELCEERLGIKPLNRAHRASLVATPAWTHGFGGTS